jgi:hypothetical protein
MVSSTEDLYLSLLDKRRCMTAPAAGEFACK